MRFRIENSNLAWRDPTVLACQDHCRPDQCIPRHDSHFQQTFSFAGAFFGKGLLSRINQVHVNPMLRNDSGRPQCTFGGGLHYAAPPGSPGQGHWETNKALAHKNVLELFKGCITYIDPETNVSKWTNRHLNDLCRDNGRAFVACPPDMAHIQRHNPSWSCYRCVKSFNASRSDVGSSTALRAAEAIREAGQGSLAGSPADAQ